MICCNQHNFFSPLIFLILSLSSLVNNALAETSSSIYLELGSSNNDDKNRYISGRFGLDNGIQLKAGFGKNISKDSSGIELESKSRSFGIQTDPTSLFNAGLNISNTSQDSSIEIRSRNLTLEINTLDWNLFASPETRGIDIQTTIGSRSIKINSNGIAAGVSYYGWDPFYVAFSAIRQSYSRNLAALNTLTNLFANILSSNTVDQVFALEDERNTFEAGYFFDQGSIALSHSKGRSVVDQSIATVNTIRLSYTLNKNWSIGSSVGTSELNISNNTTRFGRANLSYKW